MTEVTGPMIDSSKARQELLRKQGKPTSRSDIVDAISITSGKEFTVFQKKSEAIIKTIAAGRYLPLEHSWNGKYLLGKT